jgi:hypothetical protein
MGSQPGGGLVKIPRNMSSKFYSDFIPIYGYMVSGHLRPDASYETTPKWQSFFFDQTDRFGGQRRG